MKIRKTLKRYFFTEPWDVPNPRNSDIYLVSYPKSGNTWFRYLLMFAIWPETIKQDLDLEEMAAYIPSFRLAHDKKVMLDVNSPCNKLANRIIKEHTRMDRRANKFIRKAIYIIRDGRDAIISYWHFCNQRDGTNYSLDEFIEKSSNCEHYYGSWSEHVKSWLTADIDKVVIYYENLINNPYEEIRKVSEKFDLCLSDKCIKDAIDAASFENLRAIEKSKGLKLEQLKRVKFFRSGKSGGWSEKFDVSTHALFVKHHGNPSDFGY